MIKKVTISNMFLEYIHEAICELQNYKIEDSYNTIIRAMNINPDAPEPHNLLGILYELKENEDLARKHYRAAYALNPTYRPASANLQRVCTLEESKKIPLDYGEDNLVEKIPYISRIIQNMPLENEDIQLLEVEIESGYHACGQQIMDLGLTEHLIIGCIVRGQNTIVPNGRTEIRVGDKLMIFANRVSGESVLSVLK